MPSNYNTLLRNTYFKEKKSLCDKLGIKVTNFEKSWTILILIFQSDCIFGCQLRYRFSLTAQYTKNTNFIF